jgi:predicted RNA-binding Zn-ribbon protein involved in translation (DUF1610 family)
MGRKKAADEVFCTSCGAAIKKQAEICPECGVRNQNQSRPTGGRSSMSTGQGRRDPADVETTVSDSWWYGVAGGAALWVVLLGIVGSAPPAAEAFLGLLLLVAWIGLPLAAYYDMQYVRSKTQWRPNTGLWVLGFLVWFLNVPLAVVYLYRRHETLGTP